MADGSRLGGRYSDELIKALWSDADEAAVRSWEQQKRAAFDAGGELKATHGTRAALEEWMAEKVYGLGGTMDRNLRLRANPRVFFDLEADGAPLGRVVMLLRADVVPETAKARASRRGRAPAAPHRSAFVRAFCADLPRAVYRRAARAAAVQGLGVPPRGPGLRVRGRRIVPPRGPGLRVRVERIVGRCRGAVSTVVGRNEI